MAKLHKFEPVKTYATRENAIKAVEKIFGNEWDNLRYFITVDEKTGRYFPVFIGQEALSRRVHHFGFHIIG